MPRSRIRLSRSVSVKAVSRRPHLFKAITTSCESDQNSATISSAPKISLAQNSAAPSPVSTNNKLLMISSNLFTENPLENSVDVFEVIIQVERLADLGFAQGSDHFLVGQQLGLEIGALLPDFHGIALNQAIGIFA